MKETNFRTMILSGFKADRERALLESKENRIENSWSYEIEIFLLTLKSLIPSLKCCGNRIDYIRFQKELELWKSYRHGGNSAIMEVLRNEHVNYWQNRDETIPMRALAIIFANESIDIVKEEVLKNIAYFTGEAEQILEGLYFSSFLTYLFNGHDAKEAGELSKKEILGFSVKDDLLERNYLKLDLGSGYGKYVVNFERKRIELLDKLRGRVTNSFRLLDELESFMGSCDSAFESKAGKFIGAFDSAYDEVEKDQVSDIISRYIWRLRKGWISPDQLKIVEYVEPDIFGMKIGEESFHSLLNKIKLISKEERDGFEVRYIGTKMGIYRFFKRKNGR